MTRSSIASWTIWLDESKRRAHVACPVFSSRVATRSNKLGKVSGEDAADQSGQPTAP
jgi:hypothetical protein